MRHILVSNFEKDLVYIFQFAGNAFVSSLSPFCIKVEAFCRLHNLKFERKNTTSRGSNGLLPFIELNGQQTADSEFIIKRLTDHFKLKNFTDAKREGVGHAIERMIENHTMHLLRFDMGRTMTAMTRVYLRDNNVPSFAVPAVATIGAWSLRRKLRRIARTAIGSFTDAEYDEMLRNDLQQLQNVLGDQQFLMGGEPTRVDCVAVAHIGLAYYTMPSARSRVHELLESNDLTTFRAYLERTVKRIFGNEFNDKK
ncbi:hypothetical protein PENTCL1PPCAC_7504, partial [Pristionchus entomophagus]